ncbi:hypothetical protein [Thermococcus camini]|uniref:hypothetical protein n=1 Tax=Thermococcus camini TaxID=2016373 RepID=UPI001FE562E5|nr:hypothetical protein [Thermococcus camini]
MGLFHFFLRLPVLAFRMAGIVRVSNRAKRRFRRELVESGLPDEIVEELVNYFNPSTPLREMLFRFSMR